MFANPWLTSDYAVRHPRILVLPLGHEFTKPRLLSCCLIAWTNLMEVILLRHPSTHHLFTHPIIAGISVVASC